MYEISTEELPVQTWLTISESLPREHVPGFLGGAYPTLFAALGAAGVAPSGPPVARYHVGETTFDVTAGVPFTGDFEPAAPLQVQTLPPMTVASTVHTGAYDGLPGAFHAVMEWIQTNGWVITADPWECYLDGPEVSEPRTKVCFPVARA